MIGLPTLTQRWATGAPWKGRRHLFAIDFGVEWELRQAPNSGSYVCQDCRAVVVVRYNHGALEEDRHECDADAAYEEAERRASFKQWLRKVSRTRRQAMARQEEADSLVRSRVHGRRRA